MYVFMSDKILLRTFFLCAWLTGEEEPAEWRLLQEEITGTCATWIPGHQGPGLGFPPAKRTSFTLPVLVGFQGTPRAATRPPTFHRIFWYFSIRRRTWAAVLASSSCSRSECLPLLKKRFGAITVEMFHTLMRFLDSLAITLLKNVMRA